MGIEPLAIGKTPKSAGQSQTHDAFGFRWAKRDTYESPAVTENMRRWLVERYRNDDPDRLARWLEGDRKIFLDAGCGTGYSGPILYGDHSARHDYLGVDLSTDVEVARVRFAEGRCQSDFLQTHQLEMPVPDSSFDMIFTEGVLRQTDSNESAIKSLATKLKQGGRFLFYVKKAVNREFTDDHVRGKLHLMTDRQAWKASPDRYWDYNFRGPGISAKEVENVEELDLLFSQVVSRQLVGEVELGAFPSGGMDSGSMTAIAVARNPCIKSFTCGFDLNSASELELGFDECDKAELMSYLFNTEHYDLVLKAGDMESVMSKIARHMEEPCVGQSYPNYYVTQLASKFIKVVLSETSGDELFGGYPWRYCRAVVNDSFEHYLDNYYQFWQRLIPNQAIQAVFAPIWSEVKHVWTQDLFRGVFQEHAQTLMRPEDYVNHSLYFEAKTFLRGSLIVEDKLSMAHGLESQVLFMDNDLVDFAMRAPAPLKLHNLDSVVGLNENEPGPKTLKYFQKNRDGKLLLRRAVARHIPTEIVDGEKKAFRRRMRSGSRARVSNTYAGPCLMKRRESIATCTGLRCLHWSTNISTVDRIGVCLYGHCLTLNAG